MTDEIAPCCRHPEDAHLSHGCAGDNCFCPCKRKGRDPKPSEVEELRAEVKRLTEELDGVCPHVDCGGTKRNHFQSAITSEYEQMKSKLAVARELARKWAIWRQSHDQTRL